MCASAFTCAAIDAASARGGAENLMNSPGYQRRLQESRQQLRDQALRPQAAPRDAVGHRKPHRAKDRRHRRH
ncbi:MULTISPECIES: hypothetical protein [Rhodopseudomonas]|nr:MULTISPECIES: hypothetical protein [Rhodopseudomonas]MDF3812122.1 hypothetical protein [Rhodopseudomonas sp. BAL398]WOK20668.1 hypothetical protein RBJ75_10840 [Rhodopseudomonas sp. BAL398]